jgi:hypothetical protein
VSKNKINNPGKRSVLVLRATQEEEEEEEEEEENTRLRTLHNDVLDNLKFFAYITSAMKVSV